MARRDKIIRAERRATRTRARLQGVNVLSRVSVFRSLKHIYAQIIDDTTGTTLASSSSLTLKQSKGDKKVIAKLVGLDLAKRAQELNINQVVFDRGGFLYHGRVQQLAEGLREGGLVL